MIPLTPQARLAPCNARPSSSWPKPRRDALNLGSDGDCRQASGLRFRLPLWVTLAA